MEKPVAIAPEIPALQRRISIFDIAICDIKTGPRRILDHS
jgi:hypothetical protein